MQAEVNEVRARHGIGGSVRYLERHGVLGPDVIAAHCIYIDDAEVEVLARTGTYVAHCPVSNVKIEARMAPVPAMLRAGVVLGLGTDCAASNNGMDLFSEMKCAGRLKAAPATRRSSRRRTSSACTTRRRRPGDGSSDRKPRSRQACRSDHPRPGQPPPRAVNDVYGNLVYAARGADVRHVFVDGRAIILDRRLLAIDEAELARNVSAIGARLRDLAPGSAERSGQIRERQRARPNVTMNAVASRAQAPGWQRLQPQILPTWTSPLCTMSEVR